MKLLIIADDFTGALDTGVQFSNIGINTLVKTGEDLKITDVDKSVEVLVINTESRHLSFEKAYERIKNILIVANRIGIPYIYKKVDSALRGNVSAEIKAIIDYSGEKTIPFLPSYPEMKRYLIDGNLYIDEVLVSESIFGEDPYEPVTESNLLTRLKNEANISAQLIQEHIITNSDKDLLIFDALTVEDLLKHGEALQNENLLRITIGCASFAKILAKLIFNEKKIEQHLLKKPIVIISGSVNSITKSQIEYAENNSFTRISLSIDQLLDLDYWDKFQGKRDIQNYLNCIKKDKLVIFETFSEKTTNDLKDSFIDKSDYRFIIGKSLGKLTQELWNQSTNGTFLFIGGDTLFQSMEVLGVDSIKPLIEISKGVVLSIIKWKNKEIQVITKSGGFGHRELFEDIKLISM